MVLERECNVPTSDLELEAMDREYETTTLLSATGCHPNSITAYRLHLHTMNMRRPERARKSDAELALKLLGGLNHFVHPGISMMAKQEIQHDFSASRRTSSPAVSAPSFALLADIIFARQPLPR